MGANCRFETEQIAATKPLLSQAPSYENKGFIYEFYQ
jgi:hypothetical protein